MRRDGPSRAQAERLAGPRLSGPGPGPGGGRGTKYTQRNSGSRALYDTGSRGGRRLLYNLSHILHIHRSCPTEPQSHRPPGARSALRRPSGLWLRRGHQSNNLPRARVLRPATAAPCACHTVPGSVARTPPRAHSSRQCPGRSPVIHTPRRCGCTSTGSDVHVCYKRAGRAGAAVVVVAAS